MNIAMLLTVFRIVLAPFAYFVGFSGYAGYFLALFIVGCLSDAFDGFFARKFNSSSDFGSRLDSLADLAFYPSAFSLFVLVPEFLGFWKVIIVPFIFFLVGCLISFCRGFFVFPHLWSAKLFGVYVFLFVIYSLLFGFSFFALVLFLILGYFAALEEFIVLVFRRPRPNMRFCWDD